MSSMYARRLGGSAFLVLVAQFLMLNSMNAASASDISTPATTSFEAPGGLAEELLGRWVDDHPELAASLVSPPPA